jgi:uncharacterized protein YutD
LAADSSQRTLGISDREDYPNSEKISNSKNAFFDSEAFSGHFTDVLMWETAIIKDYQFLVEELREKLFWGTYFEVVEIIPAIENAYALYNEVSPLSGF